MSHRIIRILDNDTTPMEAVVRLLECVFGHSHSRAFELMWRIHRKGAAAAAIFEAEHERYLVDRMETYLGDMTKPIHYEVTDAVDDASAELVSPDRLPTFQEFDEKEQRLKERSRSSLIAFAIVTALVAFLAILL